MAEGIARKYDSEEYVRENRQNSGKVLLVDYDTLVLLAITSMMLSKLGYTVVTAMDGVEALEAFREHSNEISLVISDVTMPRMDGWETLYALKKTSPDLSLIFASGFSKDQVREGDHPKRPQAFWGKPYGVKNFRDTTRCILL